MSNRRTIADRTPAGFMLHCRPKVLRYTEGVKKARPFPALIDVARRAGVGAGTVSRVINGGQYVSKRTMARVQEAIEELGYQPNVAARSLKGRRTKTIGLVVPSVADPFFSVAAGAIEAVARDHGSPVLLAQSENLPSREREQITSLIQRRIDGLILVPCDGGNLSLLQQAAFPLVCFDRPFPGQPFATVLGDNYGGARAATEHLIHRGYKRILCMAGDAKLFTSQQRVRGHRDTIRDAGMPYFAELEVQDYASASDALRRHLLGKDRIDAVFCIKNLITMNAYKILRELGIEVPSSVGLLGYDDFELADTLEPPITVVRQPVVGIATRAAQLLFDALEKGKHPKGTTTLKVDLVYRGSCGEMLPSRRSISS